MDEIEGLLVHALVSQVQDVLSTASYDLAHYAQVHENLYIGDMVTACNIQLLEELNISAIVNCTGTQTSAEFYGPDRQYLGFAAEDTDEYDILNLHLNDCHTFIDEAIKDNRKVFVHCLAGRNRSAAIVVGHLMLTGDYSLVEAVQHVSQARGMILSNDGFVVQLAKLQRRLQTESDL